MTTFIPGDRVRHRVTGRMGEVIAVSADGEIATVHWDGMRGAYGCGTASLELVEEVAA